MIKERRKHRRCRTNSVMLKTHVFATRRTFSVRDISMGGLMVEYIPTSGELFETGVIDVIDMGYDILYLHKVRCQTIYDILTMAENRTFSGETIRLRGVGFLGMSGDQKDSLKNFVDHCRNIEPKT